MACEATTAISAADRAARESRGGSKPCCRRVTYDVERERVECALDFRSLSRLAPPLSRQQLLLLPPPPPSLLR